MSKIAKSAVATIAAAPHIVRSSHKERHYENLFVDRAEYVFDGNRVKAHWRVGRNGVGRWRLNTINSDLSLVITPDLRIRKYRRNGRTCRVRVIRLFESVFDALKPLDEALCYCAEHDHFWSLVQTTGTCANGQYIWTWCLSCGAEQISFPKGGESLQWPDDVDAIAARTAGKMPLLHGPVIGGAR